MVDVTKENHIGWRNPAPCASPPTVSIGPVYDLKMPPFVSPADHQSIRQAALLEGVRIGMAFAVKNILSDGMALAALYGTDPAVVLARHGAKPDPLTTWDCPIKHEGCVKNCGSYGCGN